MALIITSPVTTDTGIELATSYGRIASSDPQDGTMLAPFLFLYSSKTSWESGANSLIIMNPSSEARLSTGFAFTYNRSTNGVDTLSLCHVWIKTELEGLGISSTIDLS